MDFTEPLTFFKRINSSSSSAISSYEIDYRHGYSRFCCSSKQLNTVVLFLIYRESASSFFATCFLYISLHTILQQNIFLSPHHVAQILHQLPYLVQYFFFLSHSFQHLLICYYIYPTYTYLRSLYMSTSQILSSHQGPHPI